MRRRRGMALILVLWVLALLGTLAMGTTALNQSEILLTRNALDAARLRAAAEAGVALAVQGLLQPDPVLRWRADGTPYEGRFDGVHLRLAVLDETGRIDLNEADEDLLGAALSRAGVEPGQRDALLAAILDFKDEDGERRPGGLEDDDYRALGLPYGAKDAPFEDLDELLLVPGMTQELAQRLRSLLTVHPGHGGVNLWVAEPEVLFALPGATVEEMDAFLRARALAALDPALPPPPAPLGIDRRFLTQRTSEFFVVRVEAALAEGPLMRVEAVIRLHALSGGGAGRLYEVLGWEEGAHFVLARWEAET
ncbi:hypothetical protein [Thiofaba sp. EF100]|uniref:general secretion pathway protein GspK n=1 Tax=Thiofaba sp. EF100 TaxID=3121274 RepID=UPI00322219C3